jgi:hypothetical protein
MTVIDESASRESLIDSLAYAAASGYLGLFVGSGFSKAATDGSAPSFDELLSRAAEKLDLTSDLDSKQYSRKSLPQIASALVGELTARGHASADLTFRETVGDLCNLQPAAAVGAALREALVELTPAWLITTNYDLILEHLLVRAHSVLPTEPLVPNPDAPPIYHLHGHRAYPATLRITEEDYVSLLAPIDYQRLKLPLLLIESTTLMLGYSLGDINVRAAVAWSGSFRNESQLQIADPQGTLVQALYSPTPREEPYLGPTGETVLEIDSIPDFLARLAYQRSEMTGMMLRVNETIALFLADPNNPQLLASDDKKREFLIWIVRGSLRYAHPDPAQIVEFLTKAVDPVWTKALEYYGFRYYYTYLTLLLDLAKTINLQRTKPQVVDFVARGLDRIGFYFHPDRVTGYAWEASSTWMSQHHLIPEAVKRELMSHARAHDLTGLKRLLNYATTSSPPPGS